MAFWIGADVSGIDMSIDKYIHYRPNGHGGMVRYAPQFFSYTAKLLNEAISSERFKLSDLTSVTSKNLFKSFTETMPPPSS